MPAAIVRRRAPVARQICGREEIDPYGDTKPADVLRRLPGASVAGGAPRMRGLGSGCTQILINGDRAPPGLQYDQLNPAQVERIEITRGSTADQSAQAVAGTVNIILEQPPQLAQRDPRLGYGAVRPVPNPSFSVGEAQGGLGWSVFDTANVFEGGWRNLRSDGQWNKRFDEHTVSAAGRWNGAGATRRAPSPSAACRSCPTSRASPSARASSARRCSCRTNGRSPSLRAPAWACAASASRRAAAARMPAPRWFATSARCPRRCGT
jgi:hypothetical protein